MVIKCKKAETGNDDFASKQNISLGFLLPLFLIFTTVFSLKMPIFAEIVILKVFAYKEL